MNSLKNTRIDKAYKKLFKKRLENEFYNKDLGLVFFINHLEYLRDTLLLENVSEVGREPVKNTLATISTAIAEAHAYMNSETEEQKAFHWNNFCDFLKFNMKEWL